MAAIFQTTFSNAFSWTNIYQIWLKVHWSFVPKGPMNNIPALVQIMAWRRPGDKPLSEPMMVSLLTHICVTRPQWVKNTKIYAMLWVHINHRQTPIYHTDVWAFVCYTITKVIKILNNRYQMTWPRNIAKCQMKLIYFSCIAKIHWLEFSVTPHTTINPGPWMQRSVYNFYHLLQQHILLHWR